MEILVQKILVKFAISSQRVDEKFSFFYTTSIKMVYMLTFPQNMQLFFFYIFIFIVFLLLSFYYKNYFIAPIYSALDNFYIFKACVYTISWGLG